MRLAVEEIEPVEGQLVAVADRLRDQVRARLGVIPNCRARTRRQILYQGRGGRGVSRLRIPEHQIESEGEQHDETEHDYGLDVHVNNWWQVISITVANYGSASCAVCTVADRQTGKNITAIDF
jgi:hypothetical protein